jgi:ParB family chromosome partitioning protein
MSRKRPTVSLARGIEPRRGDIEQLFATEQDAESAAGLRLLAVRLDAITPDPDQPRSHFPEVSLEELADSIKQDGVIQPIEVTETRPGHYKIVHGERRWRAARLAGLETIPAVVRRRDYDTITRFVRQMVENVQREDLNDVDRAAALIRLRDLLQEELEAEAELQEDKASWNRQITWADVGKRLGLTRQRIHQLKQLLTLPPEIQQAIRAGELSERDSRVYQGLEPDQQLALYEVRQEAGLEQPELRRVVQLWKQQPQRTVYEIVEVAHRPAVSDDAAEPGHSPAESGQPPLRRPDAVTAQSVIPPRDMQHNINRVHWARDHLSRVQLPATLSDDERAALAHVLGLLQRDVAALLAALE